MTTVRKSTKTDPTERIEIRSRSPTIPKGDGHVTLVTGYYSPTPGSKRGTGMARSAQYLAERIKEEIERRC
jgi:hypothetical protein